MPNIECNFVENNKLMRHNTIEIITDSGLCCKAQAPIIVSASRATDIPAFYADWFFNRLDKGYVRWRNPFSGQDSYVSFANTRFIVFWSKNPAPLIPYLQILKEKGIGCYIQFTLNDYHDDELEPNVPALSTRIETFKRIVNILGKGSVVWRFDPLILTDKIHIDQLIDKIANIADELQSYTEKLVFSFADISSYKKVSRNLLLAGINYIEWDEKSMREFAQKLSEINNRRWDFQLSTCAEKIDLSEFSIEHNRCIDPKLIARLAPHDSILQNFLFGCGRDSGQRKSCGCILSKDIGAYNTCIHGCQYCYANTSLSSAQNNFNKHLTNPSNDSII